MTKPESNPKSEIRIALLVRRIRTNPLGLRVSGFIRHFVTSFCGLLMALTAPQIVADTILASKHDLSSSGPGTIKATAESDIRIALLVRRIRTNPLGLRVSGFIRNSKAQGIGPN